MNNNIVKVGRVEMYEKDLENLYNEKKYIVASYGIYQICYSVVQRKFYGMKISDIKGLAGRGRYYTLTAKEINHVLGYEYLAEHIY